MTKGDKQKEKSIEDLFDETDIISSYTSEQGVSEGVLFDVQELSKVCPSIQWREGPFQYVTTNLCSKGYLKDGEPLQVANFLDLFRNVGEHMRKTGPDHFYNVNIEFPDGTRGDVYAVRNETGRYTLMLPDDY